MSKIDLKPCPFCGGEAKTSHDNWVGCTNTNCGAGIDLGHYVADGKGTEAAKMWNTRHESAKASEQPDNSIEERIKWSKDHSASRHPVQYGYDPGTPDGDVPVLTFRKGDQITAVLTGDDARVVSAFIKELAEAQPDDQEIESLAVSRIATWLLRTHKNGVTQARLDLAQQQARELWELIRHYPRPKRESGDNGDGSHATVDEL